jgi:Mn-containing catalase
MPSRTSQPYKDLLQAVGTEEISHVELIGTTIARLLDGSPGYQGKKTDPIDEPGAKGATPLKIALDTSNIHHYLVGAQGALPVDAAGNPWLGSYVYNSGNLILDLLHNLMLESTGRLQKCRIYEMTDNKAARSTIAYLIVRDQAHENAFAKALESLGVNWGSVLPIPKTNAEQFPEVKRLTDMGSAEHPVHLQRRQPEPGGQAVPRRVPVQRRQGAEHRLHADGCADHDLSRASRGVLARPRPGAARLDPGDSGDRDCEQRRHELTAASTSG